MGTRGGSYAIRLDKMDQKNEVRDIYTPLFIVVEKVKNGELLIGERHGVKHPTCLFFFYLIFIILILDSVLQKLLITKTFICSLIL